MPTAQIYVTGADIFSKGIAEIQFSEGMPEGREDQFGFTLRVSTNLVLNVSNPVTIRSRECKVFLRQRNSPIIIGSCDLEFLGGYRREITLQGSAMSNAIGMYINIFIADRDMHLVEHYRGAGDLRLGFEIEFAFLSAAFGNSERTGTVFTNDYVIQQSRWEEILKKTKYLISDSIPVSGFVSGDPSWNRAWDKLRHARARLHSGDGIQALGEIDQILKQFVKYPYNGIWTKPGSGQDSWDQYIAQSCPHIEPQKREAIAQLMAGLGGFLNKTWHHREEIKAPTSHYEHELIFATAQLLLTYLYRQGATEQSQDS